MIKVTFTEDGNKLSLRLEGHAGYTEVGKEIVCASASILAYTVAQFVALEGNNGFLASPSEIKLEGGDAVVSCEPLECAFERLKGAYEFACAGYALLQHNYPQYVELLYG